MFLQGLEDALILAELFKHLENSQVKICSDDLAQLSHVYEQLRKERAIRVQNTSHESGEIYELYSPLYPDFDSVGQHLAHRFNWLWQHDLEKDIQLAQQRLNQALENHLVAETM